MASNNSFGSKSALRVGDRQYEIYSVNALPNVSRLPYSIKVLLENLLRHEDGRTVTAADIQFVANWAGRGEREISFMPARVLLQDFTGVPCVVDLAAMRDALRSMGADPRRANPLIPADLVIDHSVQVDYYGSQEAFGANALLEFQRNQERYAFLRWGQSAFRNLRVVPPDTGIIHQINLEYLAPVVFTAGSVAYPDTVVGTDSHTTMINGLGVLGWGVGGIEAEACMLGQPISMLLPEVVGFRLYGELREGATATDVVLTVTEILRKKKVVGKFVEYFGAGVSALSLADRATIANMSPEYGATMGFFPVDEETLNYLRLSNRPPELIALVEAYAKEQGLFRTDGTPEPVFSDTVELDLSTVVPSLAGPKRPQDRINLPDVKKNFLDSLGAAPKQVPVRINGVDATVNDGSVVIASITSCTNTSNPSVMIGAGLLAKKAVERGLEIEALGQDQPGAGLEGGDGLLDRGRPDAVPGGAGLPPGGLRLHDLHRQQRAAAGAGGGSGAEGEAGGGCGHQRQPELRGARQSAVPGQLPGLSAAGGGLRAGRERGCGSGQRAAGDGPLRQARLPARHLAFRRGGA